MTTTTAAAKTLGDLLAETTHEEKVHSLALAEARTVKKSAQELKRWNLAKDFFESAKATLTHQIVNKVRVAEIGVLVGNTGDGSANNEVYSLFELYSGVSVEKVGSPYYPLWKEFETWALSQGLTPVWNYQYDGFGVNGWYVLKLQVSVPVPIRR